MIDSELVLDIMMPNIDGCMVSKIIKRNPSTKDIPIIFLTAKKTKDDVRKAITSGGIDYIAKPFDISNLLTKLRKMMEPEESLSLRDSKEKEGIKVDLKILVVSDSKIMRNILTNSVKKTGYSNLKEAEYGRDALALLMTGDFNFLITDWDMPLMNGIELTKAIRSDEKLKDLPILMLTSREKPKDNLEAKNVGVTDYISTSINKSKFKQNISEVLRKFSYR